jgi:predicted dithiol-disulfide oxidoreductase (DUF899 family)
MSPAQSFGVTIMEEFAATHLVVERDQWLEASRALLRDEKAWTRERDRLAAVRRALPWVRLDEDYEFEGEEGNVRLLDLFAERSQLIVYHFMFAPSWDAGCPGCSLLCDQLNPALIHLEQKDVRWVAVSRAPIGKLLAYRARMGWSFPWVSSSPGNFNYDFHVSFPNGNDRCNGVFYNFERQPDPGTEELPGISVFIRDGSGAIYHTYSSYGRGGEIFDTVCSWLDLLPKGRQEGADAEGADWVRRRDEYGDSSVGACCDKAER